MFAFNLEYQKHFQDSLVAQTVANINRYIFFLKAHKLFFLNAHKLLSNWNLFLAAAQCLEALSGRCCALRDHFP